MLASPRAWVRSALPVSSAMVRASSSLRASIASAILSSSLPRSRGTTFFQVAKALSAAATARIDIGGIAARHLGDRRALGRDSRR